MLRIKVITGTNVIVTMQIKIVRITSNKMQERTKNKRI